jgi:hypothetical protein
MPQRKLDTRTTLRDRELDERESFLRADEYRKKNPEEVKRESKFIKARLDLFKELFDQKLKANPSKKAEKLSQIVKANDLNKLFEQYTPLDYDAEVIPYTNQGIITNLLMNVLNGFQMKSKARKTGYLVTSDMYFHSKEVIKILRGLMNFLLKNLPGDDAYIIIDNYMKIYTDVIMTIVGVKL